MLSVKDITYRVNDQYLLQPTSMDFLPGKFHVILGANGAGKTTFLKLMAGELKPAAGKIFLDSKPLKGYSKKELAIKRAVLSQHYHLNFPITADEVVQMGRYPYFSVHPSALDQQICLDAMQIMDVMDFRNRDYRTLSGGEMQKVQMSRVLAQIGPDATEKVLFLDEPVSHLDIKHQFTLLNAARELKATGATVIAILHDLNLALSFADRLLLMKNGTVAYTLPQVSDINSEMILDIFGKEGNIIQRAGKNPYVDFS